MIVVLTAILVCSTAVWAQGGGGGGGRGQGGGGNREAAAPVRDLVPSIPPPEGWGNCPRCQNNTDRAKAKEQFKVEGHQFDPHDLTGVYGWDGVGNALSLIHI